jgi:hypothetical protein
MVWQRVLQPKRLNRMSRTTQVTDLALINCSKKQQHVTYIKVLSAKTNGQHLFYAQWKMRHFSNSFSIKRNFAKMYSYFFVNKIILIW